MYQNDTQGGFQALSGEPLARAVTRDQTSVIGFGENVVVGSSNYEDGLTNGGWIRVYDLRNKRVGDSVMGQCRQPRGSIGNKETRLQSSRWREWG